MTQLLLVGLLAVLALSRADVKHVLDGSAHPPPCYHPEQHGASAPVPGSVAFWWADADSPFKQAYDYFKKCSSKDNCLPPVAPSFPTPAPPQNQFQKNAFLNGQVHVGASTPKIDLSHNPFLNKGMQAAYSNTGQAVTTGSDGFLGVQPAVPFHHQSDAAPCICVGKNSCLESQRQVSGQCDVATQVCCRLSGHSYSNLSHIATAKTPSGSVIKFGAGAGLSPGSIQVISDDSPIPNPLLNPNPSNTIKVIRNTYNANNVFASTIDYTNDNLGEYSFDSPFQGPPYLPPLNVPPKPSYTTTNYIPPVTTTPKPSVHIPGDTNVNTQYVFPPKPSTPPQVIYQKPTTPGYQYSTPTPAFQYPKPSTGKPQIIQNSNINNQYVTRPSSPTPGYNYPQPTPPFVYPSSPKPFVPIKQPPKPIPSPTPFVPKPPVTYVPQPSVTPFVPKPSVTYVPQPSVTPFVPKPSVTYVPQPSVTPFVPKPSVTPFVPKPSVIPFVPKPSVTPFVPRPPPSTFIPSQSNINSNYITQKPPKDGYSYPTPQPPFTIPPYQPQPSNTGQVIYPTPKPPTTINQYLPPIVRPSPEPNLEEGESSNGGNFIRPPLIPQPSEPNIAFAHGSCAAALKCVQEIYCTAEGIISPTPVVLSKEQELQRAPTTNCFDRQAGVSGKCCRDPNYVDPWPSANSLNGFDDGQYKEDPRLGQYFPQKQRPNKSGVKRQAQDIQCGVRHNNTTPRGQGFEVNFAEIPWQAMILRDSNRSLLCGGVIVKSNVVLTAAHCVEGVPTSDVLIKGGEWKLGIDEEPLPFQIVKVAAVIRHPQYTPGALKNDLALLILDEHLRLAKNIAPLCMTPPTSSPINQCIATGWGKRILQVHLRGAIMRSITVNLLNPEDCQQKLSTYNLRPEQYEPVYCGRSDKDQCDVDYGSALACTGGDGRYTLAGIFSWDTGCKDPEQIGGYIPPDHQWIEAVSAKSLQELKTLDKHYYQ